MRARTEVPMRILMLGNSLTSKNDLPSVLAKRTGAEVVAYTRGGARLAEFLNPKTRMGALTQDALKNEHWDFVVLQEMSNGPITSKKKFLNSVEQLCERIRSAGAVPVLYATWAYENDSKPLHKLGIAYENMARKMSEAAHEAARHNHCLLADVGKAFHDLSDTIDLYASDGIHPNEQGTKIAAKTIARTILENVK